MYFKFFHEKRSQMWSLGTFVTSSIGHVKRVMSQKFLFRLGFLDESNPSEKGHMGQIGINSRYLIINVS